MKRVLIAAAALAVVAATPSAHAALSKKAFFDVEIRASQDVTWTRNMTVQGCSDSIQVLTGKGEAHLRVHQRGNRWVIAKRIDDKRATLAFPDGTVGVPAAGTFSRKGELGGSTTKPPRDPGSCPRGIPTEPDCRALSLPDDAKLFLSYETPATWTYGKPVPKGPSLILNGPYSRAWVTGPPFNWCPGMNGDDMLGGTWYGNNPVHTGPAPLALAKLFGTSKHFTVRWRDKRTVETAHPGGMVLSGTFPVTTTIHWSVRFTRLAKQPQIGAVDL
jgi:hypothetical protein